MNIYGSRVQSAERVLLVSGGYGGVREECLVFPLFMLVSDVCVSPDSRNLS